MLTVIYNPNESGYIIPDAKCISFAEEKWNQIQNGNISSLSLKVSSEILFNSFRVLVKRKVIDLDKIKFIYQTETVFETIIVNSDAQIDNWYPGMMETSTNLLNEIIGL